MHAICLAVALVAAHISLTAAAQSSPALSKPVEKLSLLDYNRHKIRGIPSFTSSLSHSNIQEVRQGSVHRNRQLKDSETGNFARDWSTAQLSAARYGLGATSLPSQGLAFFAGGWSQRTMPFLSPRQL